MAAPGAGNPPARPRRPWREPLLVFALALLVTGSMVAWLLRSIDVQDRTAFENEVARTLDAVRERVDTTVTLLRGTAGLFNASDEVTGEEFRAYIDRLLLRERYPGILGIGFSLRLAPGELPGRVAAMRNQGQPGFQVWPAGPRPEYHAIVYLEPLDARNQAAIGFDMHTQPVRRAAMDAARDAAAAVASGKVTLVQEIDEDKQAGFLIYLPVYRGKAAPDDVAGRRAALHGFVYSPLRIGDLLSGVRGTGLAEIDYSVYDGALSPEALMRSTRSPGEDRHQPRFVAERVLEVAGRPWLLRFSSRAEFELLSNWWLVPWLVLVAVGTSLLLAWITWVQVRARQAAELAAAERRVHAAELRASESRERQRSARLQQLAAELRANDRRKDEFLATLAHELRNPLAPIVSSLDIMRRSSDPAQLERAREVASRQARHMVRLIDDLLDLSRISRGIIVLQRETMPLAQAIASAIETSRPLLDGRGHRLVVEPLDDTLLVEGDPTRLAQVFSNLLNNAARYTEPGGEVRVAMRREDGQALVAVSDTGIGIAPEHLDAVFEMFVQADGSPEGSGGLGIGLTLVRQLVELHGGSVAASSEGRGHGSCFSVRLPLAGAASAPARPTPAAQPAAVVAARRVLLVDDNADAAEALAVALTLDGHTVAVAHDGPQALALAPLFRPELVLLDIGLPGLNGYEVARRLRAMPGGDRLQLVAITGWGQAEDRQRARAAGFDLHLTKPVDQERLRASLAGPPAPQ